MIAEGNIIAKFRGIPLVDGEGMESIDADYDGAFVYGNLINYGNRKFIIGDVEDVSDEYILPKWWVEVDRKTVEQYTGKGDDVKGEPIYIGSIVKTWSNASELMMKPTINEIVARDLFGRPGVFLRPAGQHLIEPCLHDSWSNQFEVIGDIHRNADLLEVSE
ncbi:YopX family protein [Lactiplantibacillus herbarum]|uniref:YopX family protein n=1 Tax=Lactiplantibacillus herbarum TaxID=1670446 RepID=UPI00069CF9A8|nr:YopX family protein [Lactiplantibacillus herbarum]